MEENIHMVMDKRLDDRGGDVCMCRIRGEITDVVFDARIDHGVIGHLFFFVATIDVIAHTAKQDLTSCFQKGIDEKSCCGRNTDVWQVLGCTSGRISRPAQASTTSSGTIRTSRDRRIFPPISNRGTGSKWLISGLRHDHQIRSP